MRFERMALLYVFVVSLPLIYINKRLVKKRRRALQRSCDDSDLWW